jgi:hypothetical protein
MSATTATTESTTLISTRRFARHYAEMLAAMFLGMLVLLPPLGAGLGAFGVALYDEAGLMLSSMAVTMTVPMIGWMRYRGHGWAPCADMAAAMFVPTIGVLALLASGLVADGGTLMAIEHVVMLPSMLIAMLLRREGYAGVTA